MSSHDGENRYLLPVGLWTWDVARDVTYADEVAAQYFNVTAREGYDGQPLERLMSAIHPDDRVVVEQAITGALAGRPYRLRYRVRSRELGERTVLASGRCFFNADGKPSFYPGFVMDAGGVVGTELEQLADHLTTGAALAEKIGDPAITYLLEAARLEVDGLLARGGSVLN